MISLTKDNFLIYAIKHYDNLNCTGNKDFRNDIKRISHVKKLLKRECFETDASVCRLIMNHIVILYNIFGPEATPNMLLFKIEEDKWKYITPFLLFLSILPEKVYINNKTIYTTDIGIDINLTKTLRSL